MYSKFQIGKKFIQYYLTAHNGKGHGIHSPFVFRLVQEVLTNTKPYDCYHQIEQERQLLLQSHQEILVEDFGAGSRVNNMKVRSVSDIAKTSLKPARFGQLLFRLALDRRPCNILELGTSLGITTSYLASAHPAARVFTFEGSITVAEQAGQLFNKLNIKNIQIINGNFDETLSTTLSANFDSLDFAYIDGNHRLKPTLNYFQQLLDKTHSETIMIFDDIHWSNEMDAAWEAIKAHPRVSLTIDLFYIGLVYFRKEQKEKEHFTIRF